jgi:hypothetical protein
MGNVASDEPPEAKAVDDGARRARDTRRHAFDADLLDSITKRRAGEADDPDAELGNPGGAGLVRDGDPDLAWKLGPDLVEAQRGEQTEGSLRNPCEDSRARVVLGRFGAAEPVKALRNACDRPVFDQPAQVAERQLRSRERKNAPAPTSRSLDGVRRRRATPQSVPDVGKY